MYNLSLLSLSFVSGRPLTKPLQVQTFEKCQRAISEYDTLKKWTSVCEPEKLFSGIIQPNGIAIQPRNAQHANDCPAARLCECYIEIAA